MFGEFALRLLVAALLGGIIGLDREYREKEAGLRTHFLVALGSALFMIISQYGFAEVAGNGAFRTDPARVAAQVVSGIGFIGAGTILIQKQFVRGLTTAAGMWATAGIGLAVGGGMYALGTLATVLTLAGLELLTWVFKNVGEHSSYLVYSTTERSDIEKVNAELVARHYRVATYDMREVAENGSVVYMVTMIIKTKRQLDESGLFLFLQQFPKLVIRKIV